MKFTIIRFLKTTFIRLRLHVFFSWLNGFLLQLLWMNKLSKWAHAHKKIDFNDFPSKWDYTKRYGLYNYVIEKEGLDSDINYLEFGVANGESFNWWMTKNVNAETRFYGFDTFTGLPEDFGPWATAWDLFNTWNGDGTLDEILRRLRAAQVEAGAIDGELWCIDGTVIRAARCPSGGRKNGIQRRLMTTQ